MKYHPLIWMLAMITGTVAASQPPNILLILVDDMGYGDLQSYNPDSKIPTPHLDRLAKEGIRFTDAHAAGPLCHPSRYGLLTGRLPFRIDYSRWPTHALIEKDQLTLASLLKQTGYHTAMVGKWHLGFNEAGYDRSLPGGPIDVGFDTFSGIRASTDIPPYFYIRGDRAVVPPAAQIEAHRSDPPWNRIQGEFWREGGIAPDLQLEDVLPRFTEEAVQVIREHHNLRGPSAPLFLYLAYPAPHTPWLPTREFQGATNNPYGDFVVMVDHMIGRVLAALEETGMAEETLVIFSSDNGPVWYDKDRERFGHDAVGGLRGMKGDAYEGGHRMPFMVRWPGTIEPGRTSARTICFTDVLSTLAELTGQAGVNEQAIDSVSFYPTLRGQEQLERRSFLIVSAKGHQTVRMGKWKYIDQLGSGGFSDGFGNTYRRVEPTGDDPSGQLYDLSVDPRETTNLAIMRPEIVELLAMELQRIRSESDPVPGS